MPLQGCGYHVESHLFMHAHAHTRPVIGWSHVPNPEIIMALLPDDPGRLPAPVRPLNPEVRGN